MSEEQDGWPLVCEIEGVQSRWFHVRDAPTSYAAREAVARMIAARKRDVGELPSLAGLHPHDPATVANPEPFMWTVVVEYGPEEYKGHDYD